jgi:hypothetical protein
MADHTNDHSEPITRPELASDEAREARLMLDKKGRHAEDAADHSPAPMLPPILDHHQPTPSTQVSEPDTIESPAEDTPGVQQESEAAAPARQSTITSLANTPSHTEQPDTSHYPSSKKALAGLTVALLLLAGFSAFWFKQNQDIYTLGNQDATTADSHRNDSASPATLGADTKNAKTLSLTLKNLPQLKQGQYQLWLKQQDETQSLGVFAISDTGTLVDNQEKPFQPRVSLKNGEAELIVTIEEGDATAEQPSPTVVLSGKLANNQAALNFTAFELDDASGVFTLATPTIDDDENQTSGIWVAKTDGQKLSGPGLNAPVAPKGWIYEAQVKFKDQIVAMGRFSDPKDKDNLSLFTPNADRNPSFPGEDYLQGAPSRLGLDFPAKLASGEWKVIISLEPDIEGQDPTGDDIFFLQPFTADIPQDAEAYKEYELKLDTSTFPSGTATLQ